MKPDSLSAKHQRHRSLGQRLRHVAPDPRHLHSGILRYVLHDSLDWTEELARYLIIWSVLFGCSFAMRTDSHLELSILSNFSGPRMKAYIKCFSCIVCLVFSAIMVYASMESVINIHWSEQLTPAMHLPAWIIWMAMPVGFGSWVSKPSCAVPMRYRRTSNIE